MFVSIQNRELELTDFRKLKKEKKENWENVSDQPQYKLCFLVNYCIILKKKKKKIFHYQVRALKITNA